MTAPEVLQAYKDKYKAFPDLVERIVSQFDFEWYDPGDKMSLANFKNWSGTTEGYEFWEKLLEHEETGSLTRESIDAAYKEFGIEPLTPKIDMNAFVEEGYYWPLFSHMFDEHGLT